MKTFNITVNGTAYNVTVEETAGGAAAAPVAALMYLQSFQRTDCSFQKR